MAEKENREIAGQGGELAAYFKSIVDQDRSAVVICNLRHEIIYMNPAAVRTYEKHGGTKLVGRSLMPCHSPRTRERIGQVVAWFAASPRHNLVHTFHDDKHNRDVYMVALRRGEALIGYYEKHESRERETMDPYSLDP